MSVELIQLNLKENERIAISGDLHFDTQTPSSRVDNTMETCIFKVNDIREECKKRNVRALFILGDVFNRIQVPNEGINRLGREFMKFRDDGIELFTIYGNHDLPRNDIEAIIRSPLSLLCDFGIIRHVGVGSRIIINKRTLITPHDYTDKIVPANPKAPFNILMGHVFYQNERAGGKANIQADQVKDLGYNCMFLGHDHIKYDIVNTDGTDIVRGGAIVRGTTHDYNFEREVGFYVLNEPWNYNRQNLEFVKLDVKPMEDVVSSAVKNKKFGSLSNLNDLMRELVDKLSNTDDEGFDNILDRVKKDPSISDDVRLLLLHYFTDFAIIS